MLVADGLPRRAEVVLLDVLATGVGEGEHAAAVALLGADEALVLQVLEGGVDRAGLGARRPRCGSRSPG